MKLKYILFVLSIPLMLIFTLTGCLPSNSVNTLQDPAGFFSGIWHGWIAPISLIFGIFNDNIRVYQITNTGWFYDFGFYLAIVGGFGGLSFFRKKKKKCDND